MRRVPIFGTDNSVQGPNRITPQIPAMAIADTGPNLQGPPVLDDRVQAHIAKNRNGWQSLLLRSAQRSWVNWN